MQDWFIKTMITLPEGQRTQFVKVNGEKFKENFVFMNPERTMGLANRNIGSTEYKENCEVLSWIEFRKRNILNAITGKFFYNTHYILKAIQILKALGWHRQDVAVHFPKTESPVMFILDDDCELALFIAPMISREIPKNLDESVQVNDGEKKE